MFCQWRCRGPFFGHSIKFDFKILKTRALYIPAGCAFVYRALVTLTLVSASCSILWRQTFDQVWQRNNTLYNISSKLHLPPPLDTYGGWFEFPCSAIKAVSKWSCTVPNHTHSLKPMSWLSLNMKKDLKSPQMLEKPKQIIIKGTWSQKPQKGLENTQTNSN